MIKQSLMFHAFEEGKSAGARGEVPVGAVIVRGGEVIARAGNEIIQRKDPTAHAEMLAIQRASLQLGNERLLECDLYVTLEPCTMCAGAISLARIRRVYFGARDEKGGGTDFFQSPKCHHTPEVYDGFMAQESSIMLKEFFKGKRINATISES